ncbi:hypothetical protein [Phaeovulum vinaykumarii]|uniref:Lipoprotein n=1 Tax=Phaeovulum vinaykumarii TaxID=407234 RepID=A0A1N7KTJ7_9RHOB|nr:hypothetical protein [Phaeovulum vinaykumarii]SIS64871.1 hypothetical protein SAMN05421795_102149 [Phaeovulum vinaykumarii]SOC01467.1 hypothetical protein SAMN05878426_102625 [Phaeovulum vinaykumarii]
MTGAGAVPSGAARALRAAVLAGPALALAACAASMPRDRAEEVCFEEARLALHPRGQVALGVASGRGLVSKVEIDLSSAYLMGRDPAEVYARCVKSKSGQPPSRPLYSRTDWKG